MNKILTAVCSKARKEEARDAILDKQLLYCVDEDQMYIKYDGALLPVGLKPDQFNIVIDEKDKLTLANHIYVKTVTVTPDDSGVEYHDNILLGHITPQHTIFILTEITEEKTGTLGGIIYEKGELATSAYHFSVSTSKSRVLYGSCSQKVKAGYCTCKLRGKDYLAITYPIPQEADLYFSGFMYNSNLPTDYVDDDLTDIIPVSSDSSGISQAIVIPENITIRTNTEWEFLEGRGYNVNYTQTFYCNSANPSYSDFEITCNVKGEKVSVRKTMATALAERLFHIQNNAGWTGRENNYWRNWGAADHWVVYLNGNVNSVTINSRSVSDASNGSKRQLYLRNVLTGEEIGRSSVNTWDTTTTIENIPAGVYYIHGTGSWYYNFVYVRSIGEVDLSDSIWNQHGNNKSFSFGNGLSLLTDVDTSWYSDRLANNDGYIYIEGKSDYENPIMKLRVYGKCTVTAGFTSESSQSRNLRITPTLDTESADWNKSVSRNSSSKNTATTTSFTWDGEDDVAQDIYFLSETGGLNLLYVRLEYVRETSFTDYLHSILNPLPETGEDSDPHQLTIIGGRRLTLSDLKEIAEQCRNSDRQVYLDLSDCIVAADAEKWKGLFQNCTSIRYFAMPQGVKVIDLDTFNGCMFLRRLLINDQVEEINGESNETVLAGSRIRTILLPRSLKSLHRRFAANSSLRYVIWQEGCSDLLNMLEYGAFHNTLYYLRIYVTAAQYAKIKAENDIWDRHGQYFESSCVDNAFMNHFIIYNNLEELLEELEYYQENL